MNDGGRGVPSRRRHGERSVARLAAVQALYQIDVSAADPDDVVKEFARDRFVDGDGAGLPMAPDRELFAELVLGACARRAEVDPLVGGALDEGWTLDRLELLLRAVLRCGAFELLGRPDIPAAVVIDEYVEVAGAFFERGEPGLVNGVLDRLAHDLRPAELAGRGGAS